MRPGLGVCYSTHGGHLSRRGTEAALYVGQPVTDLRQLLTEVGVALPELFLIGVGVLFDEHRSNGPPPGRLR